ncbi:MAG: SDR family oxidoreductase [Candidatus Hydrogenedentota bacterium]|nr:MAG: SDR family oxidoreductase [Candidatus Hydrogenedentota bacterium]
MNYLVTGGAGFIGSNIVRRLLEEEHSVTVLDDFSTGFRRNIEPYADRVRVVEGGVEDEEVVDELVEGLDGIFHQAAIPSVPRSIRDPLKTHRAIVNGSLVLFDKVRLRNPKCRIVMASSSSIYGEGEGLPKVETMRPLPLSPYAAAKLVTEEYARVYAELYGISIVALRYFNVFGPRQDPSSEYAAVIPKFVTAALNGETPTVYGDGLQTRDFTYVENVVEANLAAMHSDLSFSIMNIAAGEQISLLDLLDTLAEIVGREIKPRFAPARPGDIRHSYASIEKAGREIGYRPRVSFREGLEKTVTYFRDGEAS